MFCYKCGKETDDNVRFCRFCGARVLVQEEKSLKSVLLISSGRNVISVIRELRAITGLSLADAKKNYR